MNFTIEAKTFRAMLVAVKHAKDEDGSRFDGVWVEAWQDKIRLVTTDGHRLCVATTKTGFVTESGSAFLDFDKLVETAIEFSPREGTIHLRQDVGQDVYLDITAVRRSEHEFPTAWQEAFPEGPYRIRVECNRSDMVKALKIGGRPLVKPKPKGLFEGKKYTGKIGGNSSFYTGVVAAFDFDKPSLTIRRNERTARELGDAVAVLDGPDLSLSPLSVDTHEYGFAHYYVRQAIEAVPGRRVVLRFWSPAFPIQIENAPTACEPVAVTCLVMPMLAQLF